METEIFRTVQGESAGRWKVAKNSNIFSKKFVELKNWYTFATSFKKQKIIRNKKLKDFAGLMKEY